MNKTTPFSVLAFGCVAAAIFVALASCAKKPDAPALAAPTASGTLVADAERSPHFGAVNTHLELGGTLYAYADVDGDVLDLTVSLQKALVQIAASQPFLSKYSKQDLAAIVTDLGFTDVKAVGLSSVHQANGMYRNRAFLYTPEGRHGLFAIFGGQPGSFEGTRLAPADTDFYTEHEFDIPAAYETIKALIGKVNGPQAADAFEKMVKESGATEHFSLLDLVQGLKGRATFILRLDPDKNLSLPGPKAMKIPAFSGLVRIDGIGPAMEPALTQSTRLVASTEGSLHLYTSKGPPPLEGLAYVVAIDGKDLYAASSVEFLHECLKRAHGLDTNPEFAAALASLGPDGNGVTWVTPLFFSRLKGVATMNAQAGPDINKLMEVVALHIPTVSQPLIAVRTNLPDGILLRSTWNRSLKADVAMLMAYNPLTVGLVAAMAIPAFQKARGNPQAMALANQKARAASQAAAKTNPQIIAVTNNLRLLAAAADRFYADNGVKTAKLEDLVGPDKAIKSLVPVAGEDYGKIRFFKGLRLRIRLPDGGAVFYPPLSSGTFPPPRNPMPVTPVPPAIPDGPQPPPTPPGPQGSNGGSP